MTQARYCRRDLLSQLECTHTATGSLVHDTDPEDPEAPYERAVVDEVRRFEEGTRNALGNSACDALEADLRDQAQRLV